MVTLIVSLASSQILFETDAYDSYGAALHGAALATIAGTATGSDEGFVRVLEVVLIGYSMVVFAALAGSFGAFLLERDARDARPD